MAKKYRVTLTEAEHKQVVEIIHKGKSSARVQTHARILLQADESDEGLSRTDAEIHDALGVAVSTIERVRQRFVEAGLEAALERRLPNRHYERILDGAAEARLIALACSSPPDDRECWTLHLLADQMVILGYCASISKETVRRTLKKTC